MDLSLYGYGFFYVILGIILIVLTAKLLTKIKNSPGIKKSFYEREQSFSFQAGEDFYIHFYALGLLFLILVAMGLFLFLWVLSSESLNLFSFFPLFFIFALLGSGYFYAWKKGLFE
jgi:NADH:ubiquinone oxidoreductase subunit 3 (subunit A)